MERIFIIIADEVGISNDELTSTTEFADLGVTGILERSILRRIAEETSVLLPAFAFNTWPTVQEFQAHLKSLSAPTLVPEATVVPISSSTTSFSDAPLSIILQGNLNSCNKTLFLLPDGSGSGMAYALLPRLAPDVCLIALNSPYLNAPPETGFTVEEISTIWAKEIQQRQPTGPYALGGWSAGGYYSFEVAKCLIGDGHDVEHLILIDSPCRLVYEELPMEVVNYLASNSLMGNWGDRKPPAWMINHFSMAIQAISTYVPTPLNTPNGLNVFIVWAQDGVLDEVDCLKAGLDLEVKVTRLLMQRPDTEGPLGWDLLFPNAKLSIMRTPGNHFTIVYPPHVSIPPMCSANQG
ncbi:hypothetical protein KCU78_g4505, partial [Aureobasidium melanogenum]